MVIRRGCAIAVAVLATVLATAGPARAADPLTVIVAATAPGQVQLNAFASLGSTGQAPVVTVSHNGGQLPATAEVVQAAASPTEARAVVVVLDTGASMTGDPLQAAENAVVGFVGAVPPDVEIGLVTVADAPAVRVRPTAERKAIGTTLSSVHAGTSTADVYAGVAAAADLLAGYSDGRVLVVTGGQGANSGTDPAKVMQKVSAAGVRVDVAAYRAGAGQLTSLQQVATASGGTVDPSTNSDGLAAALRTAAATIATWLTIIVTVPAELAGGADSLTVAVKSGARNLTATVPVQFAASPPPAGVATGPNSAVSALRPPLLGVLVFLAVLASALLATAPLRRVVRPQRLSQLTQFRLPGTQVQDRGHAGRGLSSRVGDVDDTLASVALRLERAGITMRPVDWIALRSGATVVGGALLALVAGLPGLVIGAALGWLAVAAYRRLRVSKRSRALADQLPDALQLIVGSLRSGFSLTQALDTVTRDLPAGPLSMLFGRAMAETRIGADLADALERAADRSDNEDLRWMVMAVRIQRETGGNLAEVLQTTADTLRERERLRRHVWALSAEGRLSAYILVALPLVLGGFMFATRRAYLAPLWTTRTGLIMLIAAVGLVIVGSLWIARWVKVEV